MDVSRGHKGLVRAWGKNTMQRTAGQSNDTNVSRLDFDCSPESKFFICERERRLIEQEIKMDRSREHKGLIRAWGYARSKRSLCQDRKAAIRPVPRGRVGIVSRKGALGRYNPF
jgi:hypothetical protein